MGAKFRLSPMIDSLISQRLEDRNQEKEKKRAEASQRESSGGAEKRRENPIKIGPPTQKSEVVKRVAFVEPNSDEPGTMEKRKETSQRGVRVPYVDVPPLRTSWRSPRVDPAKKDQTAKAETTYKTRAPVELGIDIEKLVETVLDLEINVPLRNLAGISNAVQKEIRKQVTRTRLPETTAQVNSHIEEQEEALIRVETLPTGTHAVMTEVSEEIPEGHIVADDPVIQFLLDNKDAEPGDLIVAKASEPLRAIYMTINQFGQEECLLDEGSMIVSMGKDVAVQLGLNWDPSVRVNMESASNHVEKTLGLAKNVRFSIAGLNLFLQVHILDNPPYRVLLGLPFKSLTSALSRTKLDGSSELVLTDPNTSKIAVVPTYRRGGGPEELQKQRYQGF